MTLPLRLEILRVLEQLRKSVLAKQTHLVQPGHRLSLFLTLLLAIAINTIQRAASPSLGLGRRRSRLSCRDTGAHFCTHDTRVARVCFAAERVEVERRSEFLEAVVHVVQAFEQRVNVRVLRGGVVGVGGGGGIILVVGWQKKWGIRGRGAWGRSGSRTLAVGIVYWSRSFQWEVPDVIDVCVHGGVA
jgi:hypothetical protein